MKRGLIDNIWYVLSKSWKYERKIIFIIISQTVIGAILPLAAAVLPAIAVNAIINKMDLYSTAKIVIVMTLILLGNIVSTYISSIYGTYLLNDKIGFLSSLFRNEMKLEYAYIESPEGQNKYKDSLSSILNDSQGIPGMLSLIGPIFSDLLGLVINLILILQFDVSLVFLLILTSLAHLLVAMKIRKKQDKLRESTVDTSRKLDYLNNYITKETSAKEIRIFDMQSWLSDVTDKVTDARVGIAEKNAEYGLGLSYLDTGMLVIRDAYAYFITFRAVYEGKIEIWELVLYLGIISCISSLFMSLTNNLSSLGQRNMEMTTFREFMDKGYKNDGVEIKTDGPITIELQNVSFKFDNEGPYILKKINLTLHENQKTALVGENGAGKSTLVKIICGLYRPTEGKILINGIDLKEIELSSYQKLLAIAFQDIYIMPFSIGENIAFSEEKFFKQEIRKCLELSGLGDEFLNTDNQLTNILDLNGIVPSGGQKQKLILARVAFKLLFKNAPVLILDEPTASLDAISEKNFYEKYMSLVKNKCCVFISHRLKSTHFCDLIIVMDKGQICERGTHKELMDLGGKYRDMYDIQRGLYQ